MWLSESEIAAAYRRRVMAATDQAQRIAELENGIVATAAQTCGQYPLPLPVVTLVPDLPGELILDGPGVERIRSTAREEVVMVGAFTPTFQEIGVAHRRLIAESGPGTPYAIRAELHTDGSGTFAVHPTGMSPAAGDTFRVGVLDAEIVVRTASALRYLSRHARDRAGAHGSALARVMLVADTFLHPAALPAEPAGAWPYDNPDLVRYRVHLHTPTEAVGADRPVGTRVARLAFGESVAWLDDLADDGRPLARATAQPVGDLFQTYGIPENVQIGRDGRLNPHAWGGHWETIKAWAQAAEIPVAATS